ncbi:hypothetical protein, variant 2 [Aphanomyces invadans]|uniref:EF-hand domain-containing protein n=1 Tax=Aphanomyces invadans TaxID=157072 RepID=A0A024TFN7_9STRA|nr:hypothetical protein, variant 2 [Aphanomyces invadans]ETV92829.1 hypothetical protein, variant 2 [Aphanomyces invadans]|eukprot:XP_008878601.1 hypothetical protein, variant 2 [Aphanomyces invadans]
MEILSDLYLSKPDTEEINLQGADLRSLDVELPLLKQFKELRHLDVSHNQLTELPIELAELSRLVALDVSNNPLGALHRVLPVLKLLPSLKSLGITMVDPATEEPLILAALPKLRILNAMPLSFSSSQPEQRRQSNTATPTLQFTAPGDSPLPTDHVQNVASILHVLKGIGIPVPPGSEEDQRVSRMFEQQVALVGMSLKHDLQHISPTAHPEHQTTAAVLLAKFKIVAACSSYATQKAGECAPELGLAFQTLNVLQQDIVTGLHTLSQQLLREVQAPPPPPTPTMDSTQIKQLLEVAEGLEADVQRGAQALANEQRRTTQLEAEIRKLRKDLAAAKSTAAQLPPSPNRASPPKESIRASSIIPQRATASTVTKSTNPPGKPPTGVNAPPSIVGTNTAAVKNLSLKQLKDLIEAIYASKRKFDQMNYDARAPKETMEQHMYTYLNQRFGLHALIVEYASAIMKGCARYGSVDCDVATFLHLVRNEIDEGYLRLKQKLEDTVVALLRAHLRGMHPRKSEGTITQLLHAKLTSATHLSREEWQSVVTYMYDACDAAELVAIIDARSRQTGVAGIDFQVFRKILLNYQLQGRLNLLTEFSRQFQGVDVDRVGILKRRDLIDVMLNLTPYKTQDEIAQIIQQVDPHEHDCITFTDVLSLLACLSRTASRRLIGGRSVVQGHSDVAAKVPCVDGQPPWPGPAPSTIRSGV